MKEVEQAGEFSPGKKVKPVRDIKLILKSSIFEDDCLKRGEVYLIEKCFDLIWHPDFECEDKSLERIKINMALLRAKPSKLQYRIKIFGFEFIDKLGFDYYPRSNLFVPEWYNL